MSMVLNATGGATQQLKMAGLDKTDNKKSVQNTKQTEQPSKIRRDTVEISEEGQQYLSKTQVVTEKEDNASEYGSSDATQQMVTDLTSTEDLSQYSDSELKLMYYNGDITLSEYEDETGETL